MQGEPDTQKPKRGPGRPPRKVMPTSTILGCVSSPTIADSSICTAEFIYYDPLVWKSLFSVLKSLKVRDVYFRFQREVFQIYAKDHMNNHIKNVVNCNKALSYYCTEDDLCLCVNRDNIDKLFPSINKNIDKIIFYYDATDDYLVMQCNDPILAKVKERRIAVCRVSYEMDVKNIDIGFADEDIKVGFTLPIKDFKDTVSDASNSGDRLTVEKHGNQQLTLSFSGSHSNRGNDAYTEGDKIEMRSTLQEVDYFKCCIHIFTLKALCGSSQTQKVTINCLEENTAIVSMKIGDLIDFEVEARAPMV